MKLYYLNKGTKEYPRVKNSLNYPKEAYKQGETIYYDGDRQTLEVFETEEEALDALESFTTTYRTLSDHGIKYLLVTEFGIEVNEFNINEAIEEEEATDEADFLNKIKANPDDFWDYCNISESGYYVGCSIGTLTAFVKINEEENGRISVSYIEKEFPNDGDFNAYEQAEEWSISKFEEIENNEDETGLYAVDYGVSH